MRGVASAATCAPSALKRDRNPGTRPAVIPTGGLSMFHVKRSALMDSSNGCNFQFIGGRPMAHGRQSLWTRRPRVATAFRLRIGIVRLLLQDDETLIGATWLIDQELYANPQPTWQGSNRACRSHFGVERPTPVGAQGTNFTHECHISVFSLLWPTAIQPPELRFRGNDTRGGPNTTYPPLRDTCDAPCSSGISRRRDATTPQGTITRKRVCFT